MENFHGLAERFVYILHGPAVTQETEKVSHISRSHLETNRKHQGKNNFEGLWKRF